MKFSQGSNKVQAEFSRAETEGRRERQSRSARKHKWTTDRNIESYQTEQRYEHNSEKLVQETQNHKTMQGYKQDHLTESHCY